MIHEQELLVKAIFTSGYLRQQMQELQELLLRPCAHSVDAVSPLLSETEGSALDPQSGRAPLAVAHHMELHSQSCSHTVVRKLEQPVDRNLELSAGHKPVQFAAADCNCIPVRRNCMEVRRPLVYRDGHGDGAT